MSGFFLWKYINEEQYFNLEKLTDEVSVKMLLFQYFNISSWDLKRQKIAINFHYRNYAFCKDRAFDSRRTSTFMSIMHEVFIIDAKANSFLNSAGKSFENFKLLILKHSVERPPQSVQIFREADVQFISDYALESYFKFFDMYTYIFAQQSQLTIIQSAPNEVEYPKIPLPLFNSNEFNVINIKDTPVEPVDN